VIREAVIDDVASIVSSLRDYSEQINIRCAKGSFSNRKVANLVRECIIQNLAWVYELDGELVGCLIAKEQLSIFSDITSETHLIGLYVKPSKREKLIGGKLMIVFEKECERRDIKVSWIGIQSSSNLGERSLSKIGYRLSERIFLKER
jgi:N-acetylglutamate synthase-like GNAT family acetyltransferase